MLIIIPVMIIATIAMTLLFNAQMTHQELDVHKTIASDFVMVHNWRSDLVEDEGLVDGEVDDLPGYPFESFYAYRTEVFETADYVAVVSWPSAGVDDVSLGSVEETEILASIRSRLSRGSYAGNFRADDDGSGGRVAQFELDDLDDYPDDGTPILLKIFAKEESAS